MDALLESVRSLVVYHLNTHRYSHMRAHLLEEFIVKGSVEALSLEHCVLEEAEWRDLMSVCTGSVVPGSYQAPTVTGTERKCEMDATLSSISSSIEERGIH